MSDEAEDIETMIADQEVCMYGVEDAGWATSS